MRPSYSRLFCSVSMPKPVALGEAPTMATLSGAISRTMSWWRKTPRCCLAIAVRRPLLAQVHGGNHVAVLLQVGADAQRELLGRVGGHVAALAAQHLHQLRIGHGLA